MSDPDEPIAHDDISVHSDGVQTRPKVIYLPQLEEPNPADASRSDKKEALVPRDTSPSEVEEEEPEWREVSPSMLTLVLPTNSPEQLIAGSVISVDTATRFTETLMSRYRLPTLRVVAYPIEWQTAAEIFLGSKEELTEFCQAAEKAILPAYLAFERLRMWSRVCFVLGTVMLLVGVALGISEDFGVFAVAGVGLALVVFVVFFLKKRLLGNWRGIKEKLLEFVVRERGQLPARFRPVVGAYGMYLKLRHEEA